MENLKVNLGRLNLVSPLILSSGCCGYGEEINDFINPQKLGAITTKTITLKEKIGNPPIRIAETSYGILNSIGLENIGVERFISEKLPACRLLKVKLIVSVGGENEYEYVEVVKALSKEKNIDAIELNISCPNIKKGGAEIGVDVSRTKRLVKLVRKTTSTVLMAKLSPSVTNIVEIAKACVVEGCEILVIGNTYRGLAIDIVTKKPKLAMKSGGFSGYAIKPLNLFNVYWVFSEIKDVPIIGCGGIFNWEDAIEYILAGASAVEVGTANLINPTVTSDIYDGLLEYIKSNKISSIKDLIGYSIKN